MGEIRKVLIVGESKFRIDIAKGQGDSELTVSISDIFEKYVLERIANDLAEITGFEVVEYTEEKVINIVKTKQPISSVQAQEIKAEEQA